MFHIHSYLVFHILSYLVSTSSLISCSTSSLISCPHPLLSRVHILSNLVSTSSLISCSTSSLILCPHPLFTLFQISSLHTSSLISCFTSSLISCPHPLLSRVLILSYIVSTSSLILCPHPLLSRVPHPLLSRVHILSNLMLHILSYLVSTSCTWSDKRDRFPDTSTDIPCWLPWEKSLSPSTAKTDLNKQHTHLIHCMCVCVCVHCTCDIHCTGIWKAQTARSRTNMHGQWTPFPRHLRGKVLLWYRVQKISSTTENKGESTSTHILYLCLWSWMYLLQRLGKFW